MVRATGAWQKHAFDDDVFLAVVLIILVHDKSFQSVFVVVVVIDLSLLSFLYLLCFFVGVVVDVVDDASLLLQQWPLSSHGSCLGMLVFLLGCLVLFVVV